MTAWRLVEPLLLLVKLLQHQVLLLPELDHSLLHIQVKPQGLFVTRGFPAFFPLWRCKW